MFSWLHRVYRAVYRVNRASRTIETVASGDPSKVVKLEERRWAYRLFARFFRP